jgi:septin family protein
LARQIPYPAELGESKKLVMEDIEHYRIPVYNFLMTSRKMMRTR